MKRCPQCEFIYEDDQKCCDMDGFALVFDQSTPASTLPKLTTKRTSSRRSLLSVFGVVFGVLVLAIGYASLERAMTASSESEFVTAASAASPITQDQNDRQPEKVAAEAIEPVPGPPAEDPTVSVVSKTAKSSRRAVNDPAAREIAERTEGTEPLQSNRLGTRGVVLSSVPPQNRIDGSRQQPAVIRSTAPAEKKDSRVVSIVKKTGRLLKKPFKF